MPQHDDAAADVDAAAVLDGASRAGGVLTDLTVLGDEPADLVEDAAAALAGVGTEDLAVL
ncbi:hypothetical protein ACLQ24_25330 [Micromonospora sp. DT4]|uniref:hypothetical protein n=1 Tax=Micromonospora sp. DT4 TaxID=3393438 RepID=UPI003CF6C94F